MGKNAINLSAAYIQDYTVEPLSKEELIDIFMPVGIVPKDPQKPRTYYLELPPLTDE